MIIASVRVQVVLPLAVACLIWTNAAAHADDSPAHLWETDVAAACTRAQAEAKPLVVYLYSSDGEGPTPASRQFEGETLSSPALAGFREWTVMAKINLAATVPSSPAGEMLQAIKVTESPAVAVVVHHRDGWEASGRSVGNVDPSKFIRILRGDIAQAMIVIRRDQYRAMSKADLASHQANLKERCTQLQRDGDAIQNSYTQQLDALRDYGQFSARAFAATARERQELLQKWISAVVEVAAAPEYENDALLEIVLNVYLLTYDVCGRLASGLAALEVDDRLPNPREVLAAQALLRAATQELERGADFTQNTTAGAGQTRHAPPPDRRRASPEISKAGSSPVPARSGRRHCSGRRR